MSKMSLEIEDLVRPATLEVLKQQLKVMGVTNYSIKISHGAKKGHNLIGVMADIEIDGFNSENKAVKHNVVIKSAPDQELYRTVVFVEEIYDREIYIYSELLPAFIKVQKEKQISPIFKPFPNYYTSCKKYDRKAIILENMKVQGYKHWDKKRSVDVNHLMLLVKELGRLHALSYAIRDQKPYLFKEIVGNTHETCFRSFEKAHMRYIVTQRIKEVIQVLDPIEDKEIHAKFKQFADNPFETLSKCIDSGLDDKYAVVNHGDCSINNFLFKYDDLENCHVPSQLCFIDWQMSRLASPALDLTCIIFSSTDKEIRDKHYQEAINEYYNSLSSMLTDLGSDVNKMLPFKVLEEQLKKYSIFSLFMAMLLVFAQLSDDEEVPDFSTVPVKKAETDFVYKISRMNEFNLRMRHLIFDFDRLGYNFLYVHDNQS